MQPLQLRTMEQQGPEWGKDGRVKRKNPCPACGHSDWCEFDTRGKYLLCMRTSDAPVGWIYLKPGSQGGYVFKRDVYEYSHKQAHQPTRAKQQPTIERAGAELLHNVYSDLLSKLSLNEQDKQAMLDPHGKRRLSLPEIAAFGAKSLPGSFEAVDRIAGELANKYGFNELMTVPGFYNRAGKPAFAVKDGLLIPIRHDGRTIHALQIYTGNQGKKYIWLSSANRGGPSPDIKAGLYLPLLGLKREKFLAITEGSFKAFIAAQRLGYPFATVSGVSTWQAAKVIELAEQVAGKNGKVAVFYDSELNETTNQQKETLAIALIDAGFQVGMADWSKEYKGIDDLLIAGYQPEIKRYKKPEQEVTPLDKCLEFLAEFKAEGLEGGAEKVALLDELLQLKAFLSDNGLGIEAVKIERLYQAYTDAVDSPVIQCTVTECYRALNYSLLEKGYEFKPVKPEPKPQPKAYVSTLVPEPDEDDLPIGAELDPWNV